MNPFDKTSTAEVAPLKASALGALISHVEPDSPAWEVGFEPGCLITAVDGNPVRDIIDWRWYTTEDAIEVSYVDLDGECGCVLLERDAGQDWGFAFDGVVFDQIKQCRNACTFCFMRMLPKGMRESLTLRDDDFRLSFIAGTFVTLTNLSDDDRKRIVEQCISPLRVSLHAFDPDVRRALIGKHAQAGMDNLQKLLDAGIEVDAQIVLVPGVNDGAVLDETLAWAYRQPGIKTLGIVPLGFTRHQSVFDASFDAPEDAERVICQIGPLQERAMRERGHAWVYAADEFYRNAYGERVLDMLPDADFYGDFDMFEDGIGIIRSVVDSFREADRSGASAQCARALELANVEARYICGEAMMPYVAHLMGKSPLAGFLGPMPVRNTFFGGNVNVTGLLCGCDMVRAIEEDAHACGNAGACARTVLYLIPDVVFNDAHRTLDNMTFEDIKAQLPANVGGRVCVVSTNPIDYICEINKLACGL